MSFFFLSSMAVRRSDQNRTTVSEISRCQRNFGNTISCAMEWDNSYHELFYCFSYIQLSFSGKKKETSQRDENPRNPDSVSPQRKTRQFPEFLYSILHTENGNFQLSHHCLPTVTYTNYSVLYVIFNALSRSSSYQ